MLNDGVGPQPAVLDVQQPSQCGTVFSYTDAEEQHFSPHRDEHESTCRLWKGC